MTVTALLEVPDDIQPEARWALALLLETAGHRLEIIDSGTRDVPMLVYGGLATAYPGSLWIEADPVSAWFSSEFEVCQAGGLTGLAPASVAGAFPFDPVRCTFQIASGTIESVLERNDFGVPRVAGSWAHNLLHKPVVNAYARRLGVQITKRFERCRSAPMWPDGAAWALTLSHDVDRPFARPSGLHYRRRGLKALRAGRLVGAARCAGGYVRNVLLPGDATRNPDEDPNFGFGAWLRLERELSSPAAFYVAVTGSADPGGLEQDVNYDYRHPAIVDALREVMREGGEVGLHASIGCRDHPDRFEDEKRRLERTLGASIRGVRHHYWALDADRPERTLRAHARAGFVYDSSFGLNDTPGFRRGLATPFRPFDRDRREALDLVEVPPTLMDGGIFYGAESQAAGQQQIEAHLQIVRAAGGAAVLNWHVEQQNPERLGGAGPALENVLRVQAEDSERVFRATPARLADWWIERGSLLD